MAETLRLDIITATTTVLTAEPEWVTLPGSEGHLGILPEHVPVMTTMDSGVLEYASDGQVHRVAVHYGYAKVQGSTVTVLSEMAETSGKIDLARAADAERRAREMLRDLSGQPGADHQEVVKFECKLKRALVRQSLQ